MNKSIHTPEKKRTKFDSKIKKSIMLVSYNINDFLVKIKIK